jgi:hypothetical protein
MAQRYLTGNDNTNIHKSRKGFMNTQAQMMICHDLEAGIVQRSWEDSGFRREFIAHPAELPDTDLEKVAGGTIAAVVAGTAIVATVATTVLAQNAIVNIDAGGW